MLSKRNNQLLARLNFPPYTCAVINERHILVAGGGGSARCGIPNVIEIYELINNDSTCRAVRVFHYETGNQAIMNCAVFKAEKYFLLLAGMDGDTKVFKVTHGVTKMDLENNCHVNNLKSDASVRKRHVKEKTENGLNSAGEDTLAFKIDPIQSFQTDFSKDPFQKLVRFSSSKKMFVTGGCDGHIRFWKLPNFNQTLDVHAHNNDVDDLDISPCGKMVATVSRDGFGKIWNSETGALISELKYILTNETEEKFIFRSCRFGFVADDLVLFYTVNPAVRKKPPLKSFLCKTNAKFCLEKTVSTGVDMLSTMAISDNGHFIGIGTQTGTVKMFIAFSLQLIYNVENIHGIFVTSLNFLPTSSEACRITGGHEASLLSISADNHIIIHHIPNRGSMSFLTLITLFILTLFLVFVLMDFFNL